MLDSILYYFLKIIARFVQILPQPIVLIKGRMLGRIMYIFSAKQRRQCYYNVKQAFADSKSPAEIKRIVYQFYLHFGQSLLEFFKVPTLTAQNFNNLVDVSGKENWDKALQGQGVIALGMHLGSWELSSVVGSLLGYPYKVIVNLQPRFPKVDQLLNRYRSTRGGVILSTGIGPRDFIRMLSDNKIVGSVFDQGGRHGLAVPFLGRTASMSSGVIRIAMKHNVPVCPSLIIRQANGHHKFQILPAVELQRTGNIEEDLRENMTHIAQIMERFIRDNPEQYFWFYKIWKFSTQANIVILSDGKQGHFKQSQAVTEVLKSVLVERKIYARVQLVEIQFKNVLSAKVATVIISFLKWVIRPSYLSLLRVFLTKESYAALIRIRGDYVISCGSSLAAVNYVLSKETGAKRIVIQRPGLMAFKDFDSVILPRHDWPLNVKVPSYVTLTQATPNLITPDYLSDKAQIFLNRYSHLKTDVRPQVGILIGGNTKNMSITKEQVRVLIHQLKNVADNAKLRLMVTTSRRTPKEVEQFLFRELNKDSLCSVLIIANQNNFPEAVGGILGLSRYLVISGDSISMISEAMASQKPVLVFKPQYHHSWDGKKIKHERLVDQLNDEGLIITTEAKDIADTLLNITKNKIQTRPLDDYQRIQQALKKVI